MAVGSLLANKLVAVSIILRYACSLGHRELSEYEGFYEQVHGSKDKLCHIQTCGRQTKNRLIHGSSRWEKHTFYSPEGWLMNPSCEFTKSNRIRLLLYGTVFSNHNCRLSLRRTFSFVRRCHHWRPTAA